jgi:hypothetical protein
MMHSALLSRNLSTHTPHGSIKHSAMVFEFFGALNHSYCGLPNYDTTQYAGKGKAMSLQA